MSQLVAGIHQHTHRCSPALGQQKINKKIAHTQRISKKIIIMLLPDGCEVCRRAVLSLILHKILDGDFATWGKRFCVVHLNRMRLDVLHHSNTANFLGQLILPLIYLCVTWFSCVWRGREREGWVDRTLTTITITITTTGRHTCFSILLRWKL